MLLAASAFNPWYGSKVSDQTPLSEYRTAWSFVSRGVAIYFGLLFVLTSIALIPDAITAGILLFILPDLILLASGTPLFYSIALLPAYLINRHIGKRLLATAVAVFSVAAAALVPHYIDEYRLYRLVASALLGRQRKFRRRNDQGRLGESKRGATVKLIGIEIGKPLVGGTPTLQHGAERVNAAAADRRFGSTSRVALGGCPAGMLFRRPFPYVIAFLLNHRFLPFPVATYITFLTTRQRPFVRCNIGFNGYLRAPASFARPFSRLSTTRCYSQSSRCLRYSASSTHSGTGTFKARSTRSADFSAPSIQPCSLENASPQVKMSAFLNGRTIFSATFQDARPSFHECQPA